MEFITKTLTVRRNSWSTIKVVDDPFNPRKQWAMPAYDKNVFGIALPRLAFDLVHAMPDKVLSDGTIKKGFETYRRASDEDKKRIKVLEADGSRDCALLAEVNRTGIAGGLLA